MATRYTFDQQSVRRISDTVRRSEGTNTSLVGNPSRAISNDGWYPFKNVGTVTIPPNGVIRVNDDKEAVPGDKHSVNLKCERPTATFTRTYAVNSSLEVAANGYGLCRLPPFNNVEALFDTGSTPARDQGWGPKPDSFLLWQYYPATAIIICELSDLEGSETVLCSWQSINEFKGKANGTIANRASGAISIWAGTQGSEVDITGMDPTAFNDGPETASGDWLNGSFPNGQMTCVKACS